MLFPTLNQPLVLLFIFMAGLLSGLIFDFAKILTYICSKDKFSKHIFEFFATIFSFGLVFLLNLKFNLGQFRIYILAVFFASFALEKIFSKFLWTKFLLKWYTSITKRRTCSFEKNEMDKHNCVGRFGTACAGGDNNLDNSSRQKTKIRRFKRQK